MTPVSSGDSSPRITYTFSSSHYALWAEELARERKIPVEVGPPPPGSEDACGLALRIEEGRANDLEVSLHAEGIQFTRWDAA